MLRLSPAQTQAIAQAQVQTAFNQLAAHCRTYYPDTVSQLTDAALLAQLQNCHSRALDYGLGSRRDLYRFVNLALSFGWEFDRDVNLPWMRQYLTDPRIDDPARRLELLVNYAIHRLQVEENNRAQRQAFAPQVAAHQASPYSGRRHDLEMFAAIDSNLLYPNPRPGLSGDDAPEDYEETVNDGQVDEQTLSEDAEYYSPPSPEDNYQTALAKGLNLNGPRLLFNRHAR